MGDCLSTRKTEGQDGSTRSRKQTISLGPGNNTSTNLSTPQQKAPASWIMSSPSLHEMASSKPNFQLGMY